MFELLNTGMMAHKLGKWRGLIAVSGSALLLCFGLLAMKLEEFVLGFGPKQAMASTSTSISLLGWMSIGSLVACGLLLLWASWQLYRDHVHGDYYVEAEQFKDRGW